MVDVDGVVVYLRDGLENGKPREDFICIEIKSKDTGEVVVFNRRAEQGKGTAWVKTHLGIQPREMKL